MKLKKHERTGFLVLSITIVALFLLPRVLKSQKTVTHFTTGETEEITEISDSIPAIIASATTQIESVRELPKQPRQIKQEPLELNGADSSALVKIRGIGPYYAKKILRYRDRLGGYARVEQLREMTFQYLEIDSLLPLFRVDPTLIRKKRLDTMSFRAVLQHPYLEYEDVQLIFQAKRRLGTINMELLKKEGVLIPSKLEAIAPYFE